MVIATSGTTGKPKRALFRHEALFANARKCVDRLGLTAADRVAMPVPIFHMYGLGAALLPALMAGASIDLQPRVPGARCGSSPRERAFEPTVAFPHPVVRPGGLLAARHGDRRYRLTVLAGDRMPEAAFARYEARYGTVVALYGTTELGAVAASSPSDAFDARVASSGRALPGVTLELRADPLLGLDELEVRRDDGFAGYLDDEGRLGAPRAVGAPWPTRDHAALDDDGRLVLRGRADDAVKRDGVLVRLPDVEARLLEIAEGVERAVVS